MFRLSVTSEGRLFACFLVTIGTQQFVRSCFGGKAQVEEWTAAVRVLAPRVPRPGNPRSLPPPPPRCCPLSHTAHWPHPTVLPAVVWRSVSFQSVIVIDKCYFQYHSVQRKQPLHVWLEHGRAAGALLTGKAGVHWCLYWWDVRMYPARVHATIRVRVSKRGCV